VTGWHRQRISALFLDQPTKKNAIFSVWLIALVGAKLANLKVGHPSQDRVPMSSPDGIGTVVAERDVSEPRHHPLDRRRSPTQAGRRRKLAKKEGKGQSWISNRLRFGRFLNFIPNGYKFGIRAPQSHRAPIPLLLGPHGQDRRAQRARPGAFLNCP
jgi:hypothetical protein